MQQALNAIGILSSLCGLALMVRYGFRFQSRLEFGSVMPVSYAMSAEEMQKHRNDLMGRFGFVLTALGVLLQAGSAYCVWMRG